MSGGHHLLRPLQRDDDQGWVVRLVKPQSRSVSVLSSSSPPSLRPGPLPTHRPWALGTPEPPQAPPASLTLLSAQATGPPGLKGPLCPPRSPRTAPGCRGPRTPQHPATAASGAAVGFPRFDLATYRKRIRKSCK